MAIPDPPGRLVREHIARTAVGVENRPSRAVDLMASIGRSWLPDVVTVDVASTVYQAALLHPGKIPWTGRTLTRIRTVDREDPR